MFKLDNNFLIELGLGGLPPAEKNKMLNHIYETLEMRVGMKLAQRMTNDQLDEFESFIDKNDQDGALKWLETNFPNYKQVVAEELERLKTEIKTAAPQIVAASQEAQAQMPPQPTQQPQQYPSPQPFPQNPQFPSSPQMPPQPTQQPQQYPSPQPFPQNPQFPNSPQQGQGPQSF